MKRTAVLAKEEFINLNAMLPKNGATSKSECRQRQGRCGRKSTGGLPKRQSGANPPQIHAARSARKFHLKTARQNMPPSGLVAAGPRGAGGIAIPQSGTSVFQPVVVSGYAVPPCSWKSRSSNSPSLEMHNVPVALTAYINIMAVENTPTPMAGFPLT